MRKSELELALVRIDQMNFKYSFKFETARDEYRKQR